MWDNVPDVKGELNNFYEKHKPPVAVEIFSSAWCNLSCSYCYIPKHQFISEIHKNVIKSIKDGTFLENIYQKFGTRLEALTHWGTEPTLTVMYFKEFYERAIELFPNLHKIQLSSNFMTNPQSLVDFIDNLPRSRKFNIDIQMSLDGPYWITEKNRGKDSTDIIIKNIYYFINEINKKNISHTIICHFKPTVTAEQIGVLTDLKEMNEYYLFFDKIFSKMLSLNVENICKISMGADPTIVCPGEYNKQDGINFNKVYLNQLELNKQNNYKCIRMVDSNYYQRFIRVLNFIDEIYTKHLMSTCSAGDSQFGIDHKNHLHPCHDSFYINYKEYRDALKSDNSRLLNEDLMTQTSILQFLNNALIYKNDKEELYHYLRRMRSYHDFMKQKMASIAAITYELADCGLISECYKDWDLAEKVGIFIISSFSCPLNAVSHHGSMFLSHIDFIKLFCNGMLENFIKRYINEKNL